MVGRTISHYRVLRHVGGGGMGVVYEAEDLVLGRHVALKCLTGARASRVDALHRFEREARAASALNHPHICTIHDFLEHQGERFIVMELLEGEALRDRLRRGRILPAQIAVLGMQVADALDAAHRADIIHRDLTPSNLFITARGDAKILDFGLAKLVHASQPISPEASTVAPEDTVTSPGEIVGTIAYMSPEQVQGFDVDRRTDLFSLGAVLYEMATGVRPFTGKTAALVFDAILHAQPTSPRRLCDALPDELEHIIKKALEKDPALRYQSAAELRTDFQRLQRGTPAAVAVPAPAHGGYRRGLSAAALVLILSGVGTAVFWRQTIPDEGLGTLVPRQLTSGGGLETDPAISPDGSTVAFTSDEAGNQDIWFVDVHGGPPLPLTTHPANDWHPSWFPDGSSIAFVSDRSGTPSIWRAPRLHGEAATLIVDDGDMPAVSPDGRQIAFVRLGPDGFSRIAVAGVRAPDARVITGLGDGRWDHSHPAWSPDGQTISYTAHDGIRLIPATGGPSRPAVPGGIGDREAVWSPDGRFLYFSSLRDSRRALWRARIDGGAPERVTVGTATELSPGVSRDGASLAFATSDASLDLTVVPFGGGSSIVIGSTRDENFPVFAPDRRILYFLSNRWGDFDIWSQPLDPEGTPTGPARRIAEQDGIESHLACSPDGKWLAYYRILSGRRDIFVMPSAGGRPRALTSDGGSMQPAWSRDGTRLAYVSERSGSAPVWVQNVRDGEPMGATVRLTRDDLLHRSPSWSPDGSRIAYVTEETNGRSRADIFDVERMAVRQTIPLQGRVERLRWSPLRSLLLIAGRWNPPDFELRAWRADGRDEPELRRILGPDQNGTMFDVSADGRLLITPSRDRSGDIWLLTQTAHRF